MIRNELPLAETQNQLGPIRKAVVLAVGAAAVVTATANILRDDSDELDQYDTSTVAEAPVDYQENNTYAPVDNEEADDLDTPSPQSPTPSWDQEQVEREAEAGEEGNETIEDINEQYPWLHDLSSFGTEDYSFAYGHTSEKGVYFEITITGDNFEAAAQEAKQKLLDLGVSPDQINIVQG